MVNGGNLILLGRISATHGIKGQLRVVSYSGELDTILSLRNVILKGAAGEAETFAVSSSSAHGKKIILSLKGLNDINQAERLLGRELFARREDLPELEPDEYYWFQLQGLKVVTTGGEELGVVSAIIPTGSNDVYVVTAADGREYLIPAVEDIVTGIDLEKGVMTVSPPEGLLDL